MCIMVRQQTAQMPSHIPGGSSSGSAVAVAAGIVDFALGIFFASFINSRCRDLNSSLLRRDKKIWNLASSDFILYQ